MAIRLDLTPLGKPFLAVGRWFCYLCACYYGCNSRYPAGATEDSAVLPTAQPIMYEHPIGYSLDVFLCLNVKFCGAFFEGWQCCKGTSVSNTLHWADSTLILAGAGWERFGAAL